MARGGFLLEYLAMKKSNNGWDFLKHLFYLFGAFILLSIYWSIFTYEIILKIIF